MRRAASEGGQGGQDDAHGEKGEAGPHHAPALLEVRARRLAWAVGEAAPAAPRPSQGRRAGACLKRPSRRTTTTTTGSTKGGQPQPPRPAARTHEGVIGAPESGPWPAAAGSEACGGAAGPGTRHPLPRPRADSWPEVTPHAALRRSSLAGLAHAHGVQLVLEPYDGLTVTAAPLVAASGRGAASVACGHEADEESAGEEGDGESVGEESGGEGGSPRPRGYWARGGAAFLPFNTLFTKPRRTGEGALGVANTYQRLSRAEQEVISRTRRVLRQRLSSAHRRRGGHDDKVQLSIVVSAAGDSDASSGGEDARRLGPRGAEAPQEEESQDGAYYPKGAAHTPLRLAVAPRRATRLALGRRSLGARRTAGGNPFRRARRQEVTTVMSQVSPVTSDTEARAGHGAPQPQGGHGGLLQAILSDAHTYAATAAAAAAKERQAGVSARVRRGRR